VIVGAIEGPDLLIVLAIILLLFGAAKVPQLARSLGEAKREFERGAAGESSEPTSSPGDDHAA
jgi:sec-independent protein translocase protein TatA